MEPVLVLELYVDIFASLVATASFIVFTLAVPGGIRAHAPILSRSRLLAAEIRNRRKLVTWWRCLLVDRHRRRFQCSEFRGPTNSERPGIPSVMLESPWRMFWRMPGFVRISGDQWQDVS